MYVPLAGSLGPAVNDIRFTLVVDDPAAVAVDAAIAIPQWLKNKDTEYAIPTLAKQPTTRRGVLPSSRGGGGGAGVQAEAP